MQKGIKRKSENNCHKILVGSSSNKQTGIFDNTSEAYNKLILTAFICRQVMNTETEQTNKQTKHSHKMGVQSQLTFEYRSEK